MSAAATISTETIQEALHRAKQLAAASCPAPQQQQPVVASSSSAIGGGAGGGGGGSESWGVVTGRTTTTSTTSSAAAPFSMMDLAAAMPPSGGGNGMASFGGFMGGGMNGGGGDVSVEQIEVPDHCVGLVIGRGGENINQIQNQSGCRVQLAPDSGGRTTRSCTLQGSRQNIETAKTMIMEVIAKVGNRGPPNRASAPGGGMMAGIPASLAAAVYEHSQQGENVTYEMMVPGPKCGLIIGKGGETIKSLQERAGVKMVMIQETADPTGGSKPLRIIGPPDKVEHAKILIEEVVNSREDNPPRGNFGARSAYQQKSVGEVIVPKSSVGMIIGKGGENIKRMAAESGAKIQFKQDEDPDANERTAVIQGTPDEIQRATQMISEIVNKAMNGMVGGGLGGGGGGRSQEGFFMHVPATKTGLVIGKGGETIRQISAESGAHVELSRDPPPNDDEKIFVIKGTAYQIHHATHLIRMKVGDLQPGTPLPPFTGGLGGGGANQMGAFNAAPQQQSNNPYAVQPANNPYQNWADFGGQQQQQHQQQLQQQGAGGDPLATAAWNQYYQAQQQQQQFNNGQTVAAQAAAAQQQQGAAQPAVNPATGQPDYSAQWAEYYRNIGMHEQAAIIEQQAKRPQQTAVTPANFYAQQQGAAGGGGGGAGPTAAAQQFGGMYTAGAAANPAALQQQQFPGFTPGGQY